MESLVYFAPDGVEIADPSADFLWQTISQSAPSYWEHRSGSAALRVVEMPSRMWNTKAPSLEFLLHEPHGFHFNYFAPNQELTTLTGDGGKPWVLHGNKAKPFYVPHGCFVSRAIACEIVAEFQRSRQPWPGVNWVDWWSLDLPIPPYTKFEPGDVIE
jgi:hypothetical protein